MLRSASRILGYRLSAQDGEVGRCMDFLLEPRTWIVRYLLVDAAPPAGERRALVSPFRLRKAEWASRRWVVDGTRDQVELELARAPSLQSLKQLIGFGLDDAQGNVGHIEDLIVDDDSWHCRYLVLNGEIRLGGRKALVPTEWLGSVQLAEHRVAAPVPRARIENQPEFNPDAPVYQVRGVSAEAAGTSPHDRSPAEPRVPSSSRRFHPPLAWAAALQWGSRALGTALRHTQEAGGRSRGI
ncbi:MAG TPA: hypothetical protein VFS67_13070 [Polyangiaceae bacterium]|nr:hypothetical protein [Polyangiaceae bacterium]